MTALPNPSTLDEINEFEISIRTEVYAFPYFFLSSNQTYLGVVVLRIDR